MSPFQPHINDHHEFLSIRNRILRQPSTRQSQTAMNAATIHINNDGLDQSAVPAEQLPIEMKATRAAHEHDLIVHFTHEKRFQSLKRDMHEIYDGVFRNTPVADVKLIVGTRNRRDARSDLIRKRPNRTLLQNKPRKGKPALAIRLFT